MAINWGWLQPPKAESPDGTMALVDHLRELRYRIIVSAIAVVVVTALSFIWYQELFDFLLKPAFIARDMYLQSHPDADAAQIKWIVSDVQGGFMLMLRICGVAGLILSCPVWLYQLWAFIMPGLLANEKKYAVRFLGAAIPLFLLGVALGYWISPKGFAVLMQFNPAGVENLNDLTRFLNFELRMLVIFGLAFLLPVVVVALNLMNVVRATALAKHRNVAIFALFVFAAFATPSVDPFSMLALAIPMAMMYLISELICRIHDRNRDATDDAGRDGDRIAAEG